jgi:phosphoesterase RecJ-like protein
MTVTPEISLDQACQQVVERIRAGRNFLITSHRNPDGDAIGSSLALQGILRKMGKTATVLVRDPFGKPLRNIPRSDQVVITDRLPADYPAAYDALFTMECPDHERTGFPVLPGPVVNIDHHSGNTMYGEVNYVDLEAPAVGEMVLKINRVLRVPLDKEIAIAAYVSLASDTGFFRYTNTNMRAFDAARELVQAGVEPGQVSLWINESVPASAIKLLGLCLTTLQLTAGGKIATLEMPKRFLEEVGASGEDSDGIVNYGRTIDGVLVSVLFKEADGGVRVSMRAKPGVDVYAVASMFGGGGHKAASGCFIPLPMEQAKAKLLGVLRPAVGSHLPLSS